MEVFGKIRMRLAALVTALLVLAGCQETLYSNLTEADANEMVSLLVLSGIPASRETVKGDAFSVLVDESDLAVAVTVLKNAGLPRETFTSLGEVFGDTGVVGTPFEERVRFAFATNQELQHTLTQIKGVDRARVHVVIPAEERFGSSTEPARASVAVFHDISFQPSEFSGRIKALVAYAVPGLEVENVSITYFESPGFVVQPLTEPAVSGSAQANGVGPAFVQSGNRAQWPLAEILIVLLFVVVVRMFVLLQRWFGRRFSRERHA